MAGTLVMEEAAGLKENSISAAVGRGHFGQPRKGGKLHQGKSVGEARRKDRSGVLAPNSTKGNCGSVEKTLDSFKDRVAQQHKLYGSQPDLAAGSRPLASKHASLGPGGKLTFAPSKPAVSRNVHGTLAAREPGLSASLNSSIFRSVSPDREADLSSLGDQGKFKEQQRYENLIENKAMHKRTSPSLKVYPSARSSVWQSDSEPRQCLLAADRETASESRNRDQQHGPKWTNFTPQLRISSESKTPCSPTGGLQSLRNSASRLETTNVKFPTGGLQKLRNSASRVETTNVKFAAGDCKSPDAAGSAAFGSLSSPRTDSKCSNTSPSIVALLYRIKKDRREDSRTQKVRKSPRVSSGSVFKRQGTPHKHTAFPSGRGEAIRKFGDAIQLSENKTGSGPGPDHYDERDDADMNSAVSIDLSPPRQGMRSEASEIEFTSNAVVGGGKSSKCADNAGGESGLVVAKAHPVLTIEETRIRAQLRCAWEATTRSRSNSSWSSVSSLTYGSELILENAIPKRNISDMEISSGGSMLMTLEVTGASSNASSSTHCFSDSSLLQKSTTGMAFPNVQHPSTGGITATADEESLKSCVVVNPSLTTPQLTGNDPSPPDPFMISSKVSPNSRPLKLPSRRINKLSGAPSRVLRNARSDEPQSCNSAFSDAGAAASVSENDYNIQRLRQGDSISMRSSEGPVMESLSSSGLTIEKAEVNASQLESPPWSGLRNTKQPKVRGAFGGGDIFENADHKSCADERKASFTAMCAENRFDEGTADAARDTQQPHAAPVLAESREPASIESLSKFVTRESEGAYPTFPSARDILMMKPAARRVVRASGGSSSGAHSLAHDGLADRRPTLGYQAVEGRSGCPEDMSGHGDRDDFRQSGRKDSRTVVSRSQLESNVGRVVSANSQLITEEVGDSARREETKGLLATERPGALAGRLKMALDVSYEEKRPDKHIPSKNVYDVPPDSGVRKHANDVESWSGRQDLPVSGAGEGSGQRDISLTGPASVSKGGPTNEAMSHVHVDMRQNEEKINTSGISVSNGLSSLSLEEGTDMMEISRDELPPQNLVNSRGTTSSVARSCQVSHSTSPKHQSRSPVLVPQSNPDSALRKCSRDQTRSSPTSPEQDQDKKSDERPIQNLKPLPDRRLGETPNAAISTPSVENNAQVPASAEATTETAQNVASVKTAAATSSSKKITENSQFVWVNNKRYQKLGKIGKGGSSEVYKVIDSECNIYALKKIPLKGREPSIARSFYQEIEYLEGLRGKRNVVQLIAYEVTNTAVIAEGYQEKITDDACIYMVLEYGEIDLAGILSKKRKQMLENSEVLDDNWLRFYWELMLLAVKTIHDERIVHADLKPANFLLVKGELKLIDFGIAKAIQNDTTHIVRDSQVGTVNYMSPEAFMTNTTDEEGRKVKCGRSSDIWSLGCILYQMVYGRLPFSNIDSFYAKIHAITSKESKIEFQPVKNIWLLDCMKRCLTWDRYSRPHISDLLEHPFLRPERASQYTLIG